MKGNTDNLHRFLAQLIVFVHCNSFQINGLCFPFVNTVLSWSSGEASLLFISCAGNGTESFLICNSIKKQLQVCD